MKSLEVVIEGIAPLLMNKRPPEEPDQTKKKSDVYDPKTDAEKKAHYDPKIGYYIPSEMLEAAWREAGKNIKDGRSSSKKVVMASVFVAEEKVPLGRKDYDAVDSRWATLPSTRASILCSRVRFDRWKLTFSINYDDARISEKKVRAIIEEAGAVIGIGSYKPKFGRYKTMWLSEDDK